MNIIIYQIYFQVPEVVIMWSRELYISLRSVECTLPLAMNGMGYGFNVVHIFESHVLILLLLNALCKCSMK